MQGLTPGRYFGSVCLMHPKLKGLRQRSGRSCVQCHRDNFTKWRKTLKVTAMVHYSGGTPKCSCCGVDIIQFLTIDHVNGGGAKHRASLGGAEKFYRWLRSEGYPAGFQVMCFNCNSGRHINGGICPHKERK